MNPTPERRKNLALRELVDQAYHLIEPFFDPSNAWNGQQLEHLAYRVIRELATEATAAFVGVAQLLPAMLGGRGNGGLADALALTGHFLQSRLAEVHAGKPLPAARGRLVARLAARDAGMA